MQHLNELEPHISIYIMLENIRMSENSWRMIDLI